MKFAGIILFGLVFAALVTWAVFPEWREQRKTGRHHASAGQPRRHDPFPDLAECDDPDWVARMTGRPSCLPGCDRLDAHDGDQLGACMHGGRAMTATLGTGTGFFAALPDDPPADITGTQPADVRYLGKTSEAYVDELLAKHAGGES